MTKARLDGSDWYFRPDAPHAFGCDGCFLLGVCGGLRVKGAAFDCQRFCCRQPDCKLVCFNSPVNYANRMREVGGFDLSTIPQCAPVTIERLRGFAPLIHHAYSRKELFFNETIAISLYELLDREGAPRYFSREHITQNFRISSTAKLIVSGIQKDHLLERIWRSPHRNSIVAMLKTIGVSAFTSPNFSVYNNVPRPENLYNIKRIALFSHEFLSAGVPTALHINACTDADYAGYTEFLATHTEFEAVSFDFITGPGYPSRMWWHVRKLIELRNQVRRQIQLILRGGAHALHGLSAAYSDIVVIDSKPLQTALRRHRMVFGNDGSMKVVENYLPKGDAVDDLLSQNVAAAKARVNFLLKHPRIANSLAKISRQKSHIAGNADDKARQMNFLTNSRVMKTRTDALDQEGVIAATKSKRAANVHKTAEQVPESTPVSGESAKPRSSVG